MNEERDVSVRTVLLPDGDTVRLRAGERIHRIETLDADAGTLVIIVDEQIATRAAGGVWGYVRHEDDGAATLENPTRDDHERSDPTNWLRRRLLEYPDGTPVSVTIHVDRT